MRLRYNPISKKFDLVATYKDIKQFSFYEIPANKCIHIHNHRQMNVHGGKIKICGKLKLTGQLRIKQ